MSYQGAITDSDVIDGLSVRYLKIFGVWKAINDYRITGKRNTAISLQVIITIILYIPYFIIQCISFFVIKVDIQKATLLTLNAFVGLQICSRIFLFWLRLERISKLFNLLKKDSLLAIPEQKRGEVKEICLKINKKCNMVCLAIFVVLMSTGSMMIIDPRVSVDYIAHHTGDMAAVTGGKMKIVGGWYPVPMAESPYYEAIYVYETIGIVYGVIFFTVYVNFYYQVLVCLYSQFIMLGYCVSALKIDSVNNGKKLGIIDEEVINRAMYEKLHAILLDHQKLLNYSYELRTVFNPLVTMILGMGMFVLVVSVLQVLFSGTRSLFLFVRSFQQVAYQAIEVCMFCFGSSSLEAASSNLQFAIYSSDWYKADVKFRKTAQMVMLRAKKGETLTAIKMYPVNVETIMAIYQFTYTVSALMLRRSK